MKTIETKTKLFHRFLSVCFIFFLLISISAKVHAFIYTVKSQVNLRVKSSTDASIILQLEQNQTLQIIRNDNSWVKVETLSGKQGYVRSDMVSDIWIKVHKRERQLSLMRGNAVVKFYPVALCVFNPERDKIRQGNGGTPEGRFFVCESIRKPMQAKYGARSMQLSYPNIEDARRGLQDELIDYVTYVGIVRAIKSGKIPNQRTILGSSIRIHGGGSGRDWTLGCIALNENDIINLYDRGPEKGRN